MLNFRQIYPMKQASLKRFDPTKKVSHYFPGKVPAYAEVKARTGDGGEAEDEAYSSEEDEAEETEVVEEITELTSAPHVPPKPDTTKQDRCLNRLRTEQADNEEDIQGRIQRRRVVHEELEHDGGREDEEMAISSSEDEKEGKGLGEGEEIDRRRERLWVAALANLAKGEAVTAAAADGGDHPRGAAEEIGGYGDDSTVEAMDEVSE
eukprot:GHVU01089844.1.p1 GENE.GHVU01089844.1~~GHVU01089844.1.p1  ORF type:complete len:207 (-),score=64.70 GHVU01089844.1:436-1056(-)